jgi:carboxypeptidase Q
MRIAPKTIVLATMILTVGLIAQPRAQEEQERPAAPREPVDEDMVWKIRREAIDRSQIMRTLHILADVHGPRLTGSPNLRAAQDWVVQQATAWGLKNAHLEEWDFGHPGWLNDKTSVHLVAPVQDALVVEALAWTPGTTGTVTASTVLIDPPANPTQKDLDDFFARLRGSLKGRAVMIGRPAKLDVTIDPPAKRRDDNEARAQFAANAGGGGNPPPPPTPAAGVLTPDQAAEALNVFLVDAGAALRINDAGREHGQIRAFNNRTFDIAKAVPTIVMRKTVTDRSSPPWPGARPWWR